MNQQTGLNAFFGLSNFVLARTGRDYFAPTTEFNPYTHTWSLAVEEQFYIVFPFMILAWISSGKWRWASVAVFFLGAVVSLFYSAWQSKLDPVAAFFLSPSRFWELASGVLLYQFISSWDGRKLSFLESGMFRNVLGGASLALLLSSFVFSSPVDLPMPGALLAVLGALGVIFSFHGYKESKLSLLLCNRILTSVGKISYSLYLWHWPVFVFFRWTCGLDSPFEQVSAVIIAFFLAVVSYRFVESPIRHSKLIRQMTQYVVVVSGIAVIGGAWAVASVVNNSAHYVSQSVVSKNSNDWYPEGASTVPGFSGCSAEPYVYSVGGGALFEYSARGCADPKPVVDFGIYVVGDSHALAYAGLFKQYAVRNSINVHAYNNGGCPFISFQPKRDIDNLDCRRYADAALSDVEQKIKPGDVLFLPSLRLSRFADQWIYFGEESFRQKMFSPQADTDRRRAEQDAIKVLKKFTDKGVRVVFEAPKPIFKAPPLRCADWFNRKNPICSQGFTMTRAELEEYRQPVMQSFYNIQKALPSIEVWDPLPALCPGAVCSAFDGEQPIFIDADHISGHGNMLLLPSFTKFMMGDIGTYPATFDEGFVLAKSGVPSFLDSVEGLSHVENWGRWTDSNLGQFKMTFAQELPEDFVLELNAFAFGPNIGRPVKIVAGDVVKSVVLAGTSETVFVTFDGVKKGRTIKILPQSSMTPREFDGSPDDRALGVGVSSIKIHPATETTSSETHSRVMLHSKS